MRLTIESTDHILALGELPVRAWHGTTEDGSKVVVLVAAIAVPDDAAATEAFKRELLELFLEGPDVPVGHFDVLATEKTDSTERSK